MNMALWTIKKQLKTYRTLISSLKTLISSRIASNCERFAWPSAIDVEVGAWGTFLAHLSSNRSSNLLIVPRTCGKSRPTKGFDLGRCVGRVGWLLRGCRSDINVDCPVLLSSNSNPVQGQRGMGVCLVTLTQIMIAWKTCVYRENHIMGLPCFRFQGIWKTLELITWS